MKTLEKSFWYELGHEKGLFSFSPRRWVSRRRRCWGTATDLKCLASTRHRKAKKGSIGRTTNHQGNSDCLTNGSRLFLWFYFLEETLKAFDSLSDLVCSVRQFVCYSPTHKHPRYQCAFGLLPQGKTQLSSNVTQLKRIVPMTDENKRETIKTWPATIYSDDEKEGEIKINHGAK